MQNIPEKLHKNDRELISFLQALVDGQQTSGASGTPIGAAVWCPSAFFSESDQFENGGDWLGVSSGTTLTIDVYPEYFAACITPDEPGAVTKTLSTFPTGGAGQWRMRVR